MLYGCKTMCVVYPAILTEPLKEIVQDSQSRAGSETHPGKFHGLPKATSLWMSDLAQNPGLRVWHCFYALLLSKEGCVKCETLGWGLQNLDEISHRGGSPPKFQSECRPWFAVTLIPPQLSLSLSQHQARCQISWCSGSVAGSAGSIGLSFLYWQQFCLVNTHKAGLVHSFHTWED